MYQTESRLSRIERFSTQKSAGIGHLMQSQDLQQMMCLLHVKLSTVPTRSATAAPTFEEWVAVFASRKSHSPKGNVVNGDLLDPSLRHRPHRLMCLSLSFLLL